MPLRRSRRWSEALRGASDACAASTLASDLCLAAPEIAKPCGGQPVRYLGPSGTLSGVTTVACDMRHGAVPAKVRRCIVDANAQSLREIHAPAWWPKTDSALRKLTAAVCRSICRSCAVVEGSVSCEARCSRRLRLTSTAQRDVPSGSVA